MGCVIPFGRPEQRCGRRSDTKIVSYILKTLVYDPKIGVGTTK